MIIDFHAHVYPPSFKARREEIIRTDATFRELFSTPPATLATTPDLVQAMGKAQVDASVILGIGWTNKEVAQEANDYIIQATREHPGLLVGFCSVNPAWGKEAIREVERCAAHGAKGIGELHPDTQELDITNRQQMAPLMNIAEQLGLMVLIHASEPVGHQYPGKGKTTPEKLWAFIQNFPDNTIICAHWGGGLPFYTLMPEVNEGLANVYFDSAASPFLYQPTIFESAAGLLGPQKVLMGTDYPLLPQQRLLAQVGKSSLTQFEKELILGGNARRLLNL